MKQEVKKARELYKDSKKNKVRHEEARNALISHMVECEAPVWGSIKITILK